MRTTLRTARYLRLFAAIMSLAFATMPFFGANVALAQSSASQQLAERFAPIAYLRTQSKPCDSNGEAYFPAPVEIVLGNPEVALKRNDGGQTSADDPIIKMGPTAQDLAGLGDQYYLDFPGDPRRARCTFESDFKRFAAEAHAQPTTYARIVTDQAAGKLVLQYWFWYYFNDWNNTHESDWEMIQLVFNATSAEAALGQTPSLVGYAQHAGGETARWDDSKLRIEDGHPAVFPGAGSHATYYGQEQYIGWGENGTGFGCDNTTAPSTPTPLKPVLIPDTPSADGPFAWIDFTGRWGQREPWEFNGPFGPNTGGKWRDPLGAMDTWRDYSLRIPASRTLGPNATGFFCSVVGGGSKLLIEFGTRPWLLLTIVLATTSCLVGLFVVEWRALWGAVGVYGQHLRVFLGIGLWAIPIGIIFNGFVFLVRDNPPMDWVIKWFNDTPSAQLLSAVIVGGVQQALMILVVTPPVIHAVSEFRAGRSPRVLKCFRTGYQQLWPLVLGFVILYVTLGILVAIVIGIPIAIWLSVRWQFYGQAAVLDRAPNGRTAVRTSGAAVRCHWWQALGVAVVFQAIALLPGPIVGLLLLLGGKTTVQFANALSSLVYSVTVPVSVIGLTLAYERFQALRIQGTMSSGDPELNIV